MAAYEGRDISHRQAFNLLNDLFFNMTGRYRFANYELFLIMRIRIGNIDAKVIPIAKRLSKDRCRREE